MASPALSLKGRALRYLAQREHSRSELERKLMRTLSDQARRTARQDGGQGDGHDDGQHGAGHDPDPALDADAARARIAAVLDTLEAADLLSDRRAAEALVGAQSRRLGQQSLRHRLQQRGLAPDLVASALATVQGTELTRAREVWQRRFGAPAADAAGRAKQARFLAGRGFAADVIRRVVSGQDDQD